MDFVLNPWNTCKAWIETSNADFVSSAVCHEYYGHSNNLKIESDARSETADISVKTLELFEKRVKPVLRRLNITCLCTLSFRIWLKDFSQTEQNQLMSTPQEQNVDWERGRVLRIYVGFQVIKFHCFTPPPSPHSIISPQHHHHISIVFPSTTTATTTCLLFSILRQLDSFFSARDSIKDCHLTSLVHSIAMPRVVNNNHGFRQLLADCPVHQRQFLLKTATLQQPHALVLVLYNILMGHISIPLNNKQILQTNKDALLDQTRPNVPYKTKKRVLVQEGSGLLKTY